jgi:hypothetical protein
MLAALLIDRLISDRLHQINLYFFLSNGLRIDHYNVKHITNHIL